MSDEKNKTKEESDPQEMVEKPNDDIHKGSEAVSNAPLRKPKEKKSDSNKQD